MGRLKGGLTDSGRESPPIQTHISLPLPVLSPNSHALSLASLDYYEARGGEEVFGHPITKPFLERGLIVEYLQRARMEWHPDKRRVQPGFLGEVF